MLPNSNNDKFDLLNFQKSLNEQFLNIFESKKLGNLSELTEGTSKLGLIEEINQLNFFIPLKELKNISMTNTFEEINLLDSWICGFNQIRGEVFTILDLTKIILLFLNKEIESNLKKMSGDNRIVYLKKYNETSVGLIINTLALEYTAEYTRIIKINKTDKISWELDEDIDFNIFVKKENMSEEEFSLISKMNNLTKSKQDFIKEDMFIDTMDYKNRDLLFYLIGDVYLDSMGRRPIFTLNIENLTKFLINVSTFKI